MEVAFIRVIDMGAAAVRSEQVQLRVNRATLRVRISENDGNFIVWHIRTPVELAAQNRASFRLARFSTANAR